MPELPEVETVRQGLAPVMEGAVFKRVEARRPDLRFPLPPGFVRKLTGAKVDVLSRRGKYLVVTLATGDSLIMHLGMSGRFTISEQSDTQPGQFAHNNETDQKHDHVIFQMRGARPATVVYNDPRRFGFMDIVKSENLEECRHFKGMGPEPLSNHFSVPVLNAALRGKGASIKTALLDQRNIAGLGNIYVCEALYRAGVSPRRRAASVYGRRAERLFPAIVNTLREAIKAGGSSLKDFASAEGELGYFQHRFDVYDREGEPCKACGAVIQRLIQGGRSTFFCPFCQR
ncbi:MAG: formamidopyrimidine-DNA glycosylase [Hyphococcus sp.]|nr:MAG: formamidopyrimidine-DNA glycosylase [Marinicaulis sp.]